MATFSHNILYITRVGDTVDFAISLGPKTSTKDEGDNDVFVYLISVLEIFLSPILRVVCVECRQEEPATLVVKGRVDVAFFHPMCQHSDAPAGSSDAFRCSGASDFLSAARSPGRRRKPDDGPRYLSNHVVH